MFIYVSNNTASVVSAIANSEASYSFTSKSLVKKLPLVWGVVALSDTVLWLYLFL